jgi:hypothetical protein
MVMDVRGASPSDAKRRRGRLSARIIPPPKSFYPAVPPGSIFVCMRNPAVAPLSPHYAPVFRSLVPRNPVCEKHWS